MNSTDTIEGWVPQPDGRGTLDIVQSCLLTIFLCCWTSLCVNVGSSKERTRHQLLDKFNLACIGMLGPEILVILAVGQWQSAKRSVKEMEKLGFSPKEGSLDRRELKAWTRTHAFFADMGGFVFKSGCHFPEFPIDAQQFAYLLKHGYINFPDVSSADIEDKNKFDGLSRFITVLQVVWFSINSILRAAQGLHVTTFELTTLAFIPCMIVTSLCWLHKPTDISRTILLRSSYSISEILTHAGDAAHEPYVNTPLDFISRREWCISILWAHDQVILDKLRIPLFSRKISVRPIDRIPNDNWPYLDTRAYTMTLLFSGCYCAIFFAAWNFSFPSLIEQTLWQISSVGTIAVGTLFYLCEVWLFRMPEKYISSRKNDEEETMQRARNTCKAESRFQKLLEYLRNNSPNKDPALRMELRAIIPLMFLSAFYSICRIYILVEDVVGLRSLPASSFETVDWSRYVPHL